MKPGSDGRLFAINPEAGYFGVVPGTNFDSNERDAFDKKGYIFTNVGYRRGDIWWEGKRTTSPSKV